MARPKASSGDKGPRRNTLVESAVKRALERIDDFISGEEVDLPTPAHRKACDTLLDKEYASVVTAILFLTYYWLKDQTWDMNSVPTGARGQFGDKKLCEELTNRSITLHGNITAYAENLGWKGNVSSGTIRLSEDNRFKEFLGAVSDACDDSEEIERIADYLAFRFAESKREASPLPPVGKDVLTFVRANVLFHKLVAIPSEGHIQQFLIAALLYEYRRRHSLEITTHHPHAADKYDATAGDIEERREGQLLRAYEVTVRDDWKNRISRFKKKMDDFGLTKYIIIASNINTDTEWSTPANMALKLEPYERDIAVVDILDVIHFLAAELSPQELRAVVNHAHTYLTDRKLSGRPRFIEAYVTTVREWLDEASGPAQPEGGEHGSKTS